MINREVFPRTLLLKKLVLLCTERDYYTFRAPVKSNDLQLTFVRAKKLGADLMPSKYLNKVWAFPSQPEKLKLIQTPCTILSSVFSN